MTTMNDITLARINMLPIHISGLTKENVLLNKNAIQSAAEKSLLKLLEVSYDSLLNRPYIYEISDVYEVSETVLLKLISSDVNSETKCKQNQILVKI